MKCQFNKCKTKLSDIMLDIYKCNCEFYYCDNHKLNHNCILNYKEKFKNHLEKTMDKIDFEKVVKC
jgi:hypothetical protein